MNSDQMHRLRAIEALRAGVPNRDVVRFFPPHQTDVETRWEAALELAAAGKTTAGVLLEGDFGTGKSHWLARMRHLALDANFVVSTVVLNKETPLHDLAKLLRDAAQSAVLPGRSGPALAEISHTYRSDRAPGYVELVEWVHGEGRDPRLGLTLLLFERSRDEEVQERVIAEWMGFPMAASELKAALRAIGEARSSVPAPRRDDHLEKWEFLTRFFRSAGFAGWVLLLDEAEMISRYSQRQRGRSYAHLAHFLAAAKPAIPGLAVAATITKDYAGQVLHGRKNDSVAVPAKMETSRDESQTAAAIAGMRAIEKNGVDLRPPTRQNVEELFDSARQLYSQAYDWTAPPLPNRREYSSSTSLRQHLRWWVNAWDLKRLFDYEGEAVIEAMPISYEEDTDLQSEKASESSSGEPFIVL